MNEKEKNGLRMFGAIKNKLYQIKHKPQSPVNDERIKIYSELYDEFKVYRAIYIKEHKVSNES